MLDPEEKTLRFGAARLRLRPLEPAVWQPLAQAIPGAAGLCLALLQRADVHWQGVMEHGQEAEPTPEALSRLPAGCVGELLYALCAPWLSEQEAAHLAELEDYARTLADFPGLSCASCHAQQDRGEGPPDCEGCALGQAPASASIALLAFGHMASGPAGQMLSQALAHGLSPRAARLLAMQLGVLERVRAEAACRLAAPPGP